MKRKLIDFSKGLLLSVPVGVFGVAIGHMIGNHAVGAVIAITAAIALIDVMSQPQTTTHTK